MLPLVVLIVGMFMSILDISIINVALPNVQNEFGGTTSDVQWVVTGYSLAEGVVVPTTAWIGDRVGLSRVYNMALLGFAGGSALCGLAWTLNTLVAFRILQGLLGGMLPAVTMSMLLRIVPRERFGAALGLYGLGAVFAPAVGPALGGYLVEYVNWRLIFFINVPIGILGAIAAVFVLPEFPKRLGRRFDVLGFVTVAGALFSLLLAVSKGEDWKWSSYRILGLFAVGVLSLALFVVIELEVDDPLLDLRVFRYWAFTHSLVLISLLSVALFSVVFLVPQFLQRGQGLGALDAGLVLLPPALVMAALMPIAGRLYDRIGPRWPATIGLTLATVGSYLLHTITLDTPRREIIWILVMQYAGLGISMMPVFSAGLAVIPITHSHIASALNNVVQRVSGAFGVAIFTAILTVQQAQLMAGRSALLPSTTRAPHLGPQQTPGWVGLYAFYNQTSLRVLVGAIDNLFLLVAAIFAVATVGALFLRSRPVPAAPPGRSPSARKASSRAPAKVGSAKRDAAERDPVSTLLSGMPDQPRTAGPAERITVTVSATADQHATAAEAASEEVLADLETAQQTRDQAISEQDEPIVTTVPVAATVPATEDRASERLHTTADEDEWDISRAQIDQLREQMATLRQQATDLVTAQTELAAKLTQAEQQRRWAEAAEQRVIQTASHIEHCLTELTSGQPELSVSPATVESARTHGKQRLPEQQTRARGRTSGQKPKLGPRQVKLARQMYDELDKNGKRRYTTQQIADAFGVTPTTIYRHLRKDISKTP
ncbi:MAG: DHA2 family efflux MFS transporter permease subunit [Pseudonocardiaceae bacterium]